MRAIEQSKGKRTAFYALMYMTGVGLGSIIHIPLPLALASMIVVVAMHLQNRWMMWWALGWLCIGMAHISWIQEHDERAFNRTLGAQEITGNITREVEHRQDKQRVVITADEGNGDILVWLPPYPRVHTGDRIRTECTLERPAPFDEFPYDQYLKTQNIWYQCDRVYGFEMMGIGEKTFQRTLFVFKETMRERMQRIMPEPHVSLVSGILYGDRGGLSTQQKDMFALTGTSHILAISGYNITVITVMLLSLLTSLGISRKKAVWLVMIVIGIFAMFVGPQASVVRAAIMGMVPLFAVMIGRLTKRIFVLIHAATVMVMLNPRILMYDPGFQLSVAATAGLILITPRLLKRSVWMPEMWRVKDVALSTLGATIATLPLIIYHFGKISLMSIPVNMIILPFMPLIMASGMLMMLALVIHPMLAVFVGTIPYVLLSFVLWIIEQAAALPFAAVSMRMNAWTMIVAYGLLIYVMYRRKKSVPHHTVQCGGEVWIIREEKT